MSNTKGADLKDDQEQPEAKEFEDTVLDFMTDLRDNFCHMDTSVWHGGLHAAEAGQDGGSHGRKDDCSRGEAGTKCR